VTLKIIETLYRGCRFRSRTEARWAVFFDALSMSWVYEKEGYDLGQEGYYLPDFWLTELNCFVEIKGVANEEERRRCAALSQHTEKPVYLFIGSPGYSPTIESFYGDYDDSFYFEMIRRHLVDCENTSISRAAICAKSARFEHGEKPSPKGISSMNSLSIRSRQWLLRDAAPPSFVEELGCSALLASLFWARGYRTLLEVSHFFNLKEYPYGIHSASLMLGMDQAVTRIRQAITEHTPIMIYGDYDADGVTSTALMYDVLKACGALVHTHIPDRREGYGLHATIVNSMMGWNSPLLITVDCGIKDTHAIADILSAGIEVIVTDHHVLGHELPDCICLNPKQEPYPYTMLAGVGTAYKLASALISYYPQRMRARDILDLVAVGTVADLVPLTGENRALVSAGLKAIEQSTRPGLKELCQLAKIDQRAVTATDIAFFLGPRINAAGRLQHADLALELLTTRDPLVARKRANQLNTLNQQRQELTSTYTKKVFAQIEKQGKAHDPMIVATVDDSCHAGIIGLIAGHIVEHYGRPALVLRVHDGKATGSARSLAPLNIVKVLDDHASLLIRYGGHALAAGLSMYADEIPALEIALHDSARAFDYTQTSHADAYAALADLNWTLIEEQQLLEPFGMENHRPIYFIMAHVSRVRTMGTQNQHIGCELSKDSTTIKAVWWKAAAYADQLHGTMAFLVSLAVNDWNGNRELQLEIHDAKVA